ncbi:hypothetical protein [Pseudomonas sp. NMI4491_12]|uniref:hypothetical protein n=1 Tax=Pseudomonas sp. NMI4491_12 TaxID=2903146 RepID=UPI001E422F8B|nr:hypothetical protein [Pseudomonas sp. NMI4491_12]MCE0967633.1 hypothetical protein [Pseudomonas sp. NMI4491_12]
MNSAKVARISEVEPFDALAGLMEMFSGGLSPGSITAQRSAAGTGSGNGATFLGANKNPADVNLRGFRMVEAEVGIEPA